jgi:hypothetical protein
MLVDHLSTIVEVVGSSQSTSLKSYVAWRLLDHLNHLLGMLDHFKGDLNTFYLIYFLLGDLNTFYLICFLLFCFL